MSDIDGLKIFKLYEHPEIWKERIEGKKGLSTLRFLVMNNQVMEYQALAASIKSFEDGIRAAAV